MATKGDYSMVVEVDDDLATSTPELEFQDFNTNQQNTELPSYQQTFNNPTTAQNSTTQNSWFSIENYQPYFDLDTSEVTFRLMQSIQLKTGSERFIDLISHKPDLYIPFWLPTFIATLIFATSSLISCIEAYSNEQKFSYDFSTIGSALTLMYIYAFLIPTGIYFITGYFELRPKLVELIAIYGYSMLIWVPVTILSSIQFEWLRWLLSLIGFGISGFFILTNIYPMIKRSDNTTLRTGLLLSLFGIHLIFTIILKVFYFIY